MGDRGESPAPPYRYRSADEDSGRWGELALRPDDIIISTRSKCGTTWMQMICALLIFGTPEPPRPLTELSPWLDFLVTPIGDVVARLDAQQHRRFIKTHTPLDGIPADPRATYLVVGRHPLDVAISLYHQGTNINRARLRQLTGQPEPSEPWRQAPFEEWLSAWMEGDQPRERLDSLAGMAWHIADAWDRQAQGNVVLVHYDDLLADLSGTMAQLADRLGIEIDQARWPELVRAATFDQMRSRAEVLVPDGLGVLHDQKRFFRRGQSGIDRAEVPAALRQRYQVRISALAPFDVVRWLQHDTP